MNSFAPGIGSPVAFIPSNPWYYASTPSKSMLTIFSLCHSRSTLLEVAS